MGDNGKCTNITTEKDQRIFFLFRSKAQMKPKSGLKSYVEETVQRKKKKREVRTACKYRSVKGFFVNLENIQRSSET